MPNYDDQFNDMTNGDSMKEILKQRLDKAREEGNTRAEVERREAAETFRARHSESLDKFLEAEMFEQVDKWQKRELEVSTLDADSFIGNVTVSYRIMLCPSGRDAITDIKGTIDYLRNSERWKEVFAGYIMSPDGEYRKLLFRW